MRALQHCKSNGSVQTFLQVIFEKAKKITMIITKLKGVFGNQLFQYAVGRELEIRRMGPSTKENIPRAEKLRSQIDNNVDGLISVEDTLPIPLVEWELIIDKPKASQFGADVFTIGSAVNLVTNGVMIGKYRPSDVDDELEIFVRYPEDQRSIDQLDNIMIETNFGSVPISCILYTAPSPRDGRRSRMPSSA